ncbi:hypothetical protein CBL_12697 [Carabus blaptoides fortunei]
MSSLSRAQSWPLLAGAPAVADAATRGGATAHSTRALNQARRLLCRHYYLEGGWGWVVATCGLLVHVLSHGLQLACSQLVTPAAKKFQVAPLHAADTVWCAPRVLNPDTQIQNGKQEEKTLRFFLKWIEQAPTNADLEFINNYRYNHIL